MRDAVHISIYIDRPPGEIYDFASNPENLPLWAAGLATTKVERDGDSWAAVAPFGRVRIRFAPHNTLGVMDHDVELESGVVVHNPMRVVPNKTGGEFIFSLLRQPGMSEQQLEKDRQAVELDLVTLKKMLESGLI